MASNGEASVRDADAVVQSIVLDVLRRRAAGESVPDEAVIASNPQLADLLRAELLKLQQICAAGNGVAKGVRLDVSTADQRTAGTPGMFQVRCPHCREFFQASRDTPAAEIVCSACGGHFSVADSKSNTRAAPTIESLAHFDLIEVLGVGGFGTVWKARDRKLDRTVAVKIPHRGALNQEHLEKFLREARAAAQLRHSNIVRVYEVGREGESVYIVSDFVRGIPLNDWLSGQKPTMRQAAEICASIADALSHAHERGVIHRDLKPANILIGGDGDPHLMDFGLARREAGEVTVTMEGQVLGTPAYMSPEQAQGEAHSADGRSDIYSLGVILFELITGELPFRGNARMLMHQVIHDPPPSPRKFNGSVPKDLETITLKCLEKDAIRRYQSAGEVGAELRRWLQGHPIKARPISPWMKSLRWVRRNPTMAAATVLLVTLAVGGPIVAARQAKLLSERNLALEAESDARNSAEARRLEAEAAARREAAARIKAENLTKFAFTMLEGPQYLEAGSVMTLPAFFEQSRERIRENFANDPITATELLHVLSRSMDVLGLDDLAMSTAQEAAALATSSQRDDGTYRRVCAQIANLYMKNGDTRALKWAELAERDLANLLSEGDVARRNVLHDVGIVYCMFNKFDAALPCLSECLELRRKYDGPLDKKTLNAMYLKAWALMGLGQYEEAVPLGNAMVAGYRQIYGDNGAELIWCLGRLNLILIRAGKVEEAVTVARQRLDVCRRHAVRPTAFTEGAGGAIGRDALWKTYEALIGAGDVGKAEELFDEIVATEQKIDPNKSIRQLIVDSLTFKLRSGVDAARQAIRESLQTSPSIKAPKVSLCLLGELRILVGRPDEAVQFIERAIAEGGVDPFYQKSLGWALWAHGDHHQAIKAFEKAIGDVPIENADLDRLAAAYFLSRIEETKFLELARQRGRIGGPFAWFYIGQKRAWDGDRSGAEDAFNSAVTEAEKSGASGVIVNLAAVCRDLSFLDGFPGE